MNRKVLVRIYDTNNRHLEDLNLPKNEAMYLAPGGYLTDYPWAKSLTLSHKHARKIQSVGSEAKLETQLDLPDGGIPWISVWVD